MANNNGLSEREQEILKLVATGVSNKEIARTLHISVNTVKVHLKNIFSKIRVLSRTEATLYAIEHRIVNTPGDGNELESTQDGIVISYFRKHRWMAILMTIVVFIGIIIAFRFLLPSSLPPTTTAQNTVMNPTPLPRWKVHAPLPEGRAGMAAAVYEDQIYLFAGETENGITNTSLRYNISEDKWYPIAEKPTPVTDIQAVMIGEKIYIPGGWTGVSTSQNLEVYDLESDTWEINASLPEQRSGYALAALEGKLYLFGGWDGQGVQNSIFTYDPLGDNWSVMNPMPEALAFMSAVTSGNKILIIGGWNGKEFLPQVNQYNPARDKSGIQLWSLISPIPYSMCRHSVSEISGYIFVIGGPIQNCSYSLSMVMDTINFDSYNYVYMTDLSQWYLFENPIQPIGISGILVSYNNMIYQIGGIYMGEYQKQNQSYLALYSSNLPILDSP